MADVSPAPGGNGSGTDALRCGDEPVDYMTDARCVTAIAAGEVGALAEAYDRHSQFVYGLALHLCGQRQAEEMTGEVFLALWRSPADVVGSGASLRAALVADVHHRAAMYLRSQHSRHRDETAVPGGAEPHEPPGRAAAYNAR